MADKPLVEDKRINRCARCGCYALEATFYKRIRVSTKWYKLCETCLGKLEEWLKTD